MHACSVEAIRHSRELGGDHNTEPDIVVAVIGLVVIAVRAAAVDRIVEIAAAAKHALSALRHFTPLASLAANNTILPHQ